MKLSNYMLDLGRVVAYYPNLRKLTGSTTSSILLCQLLYWCDKSKDGWIYKTGDEIEEETGLTYWEQKAAKENLEKIGVLEYEFKRLSHTSRYRINQENLNSLWEDVSGKKSKAVEKEETTAPEEKAPSAEDIILAPIRKKTQERLAKAEPITRTLPEKKGDWVDGILSFSQSEAVKKVDQKQEIKHQLESRFAIVCDSDKWLKFIDFCWEREYKYNEPVKVFIKWAMDNGFNPVYWTPEKMRTLYPQAFVKAVQEDGDFVQKYKKPEEKEVAPMPKNFGRKKEIT